LDFENPKEAVKAGLSIEKYAGWGKATFGRARERDRNIDEMILFR
jgi:hypothetical protein